MQVYTGLGYDAGRMNECYGPLIIMIYIAYYISLLISSIGFSIFGYFCRLGYCGVYVFANISFVVR